MMQQLLLLLLLLLPLPLLAADPACVAFLPLMLASFDFRCWLCFLVLILAFGLDSVYLLNILEQHNRLSRVSTMKSTKKESS